MIQLGGINGEALDKSLHWERCQHEVATSSRLHPAVLTLGAKIAHFNLQVSESGNEGPSCLLFFMSTLLPNFWTSRGHALRPFSPRYGPSCSSRRRFSIPNARRFSWNFANSRSHAFASQFLLKKESHRVRLCMHSVGA